MIQGALRQLHMLFLAAEDDARCEATREASVKTQVGLF